MKPLGSQGGIIGLMPDALFESSACDLGSFAELLLFSDGVYEIEQPDGEMWSFDEFAQFAAVQPPGAGRIEPAAGGGAPAARRGPLGGRFLDGADYLLTLGPVSLVNVAVPDDLAPPSRSRVRSRDAPQLITDPAEGQPSRAPAARPSVRRLGLHTFPSNSFHRFQASSCAILFPLLAWGPRGAHEAVVPSDMGAAPSRPVGPQAVHAARLTGAEEERHADAHPAEAVGATHRRPRRRLPRLPGPPGLHRDDHVPTAAGRHDGTGERLPLAAARRARPYSNSSWRLSCRSWTAEVKRPTAPAFCPAWSNYHRLYTRINQRGRR